MSRKGNGWDNAGSETLFGSLKVERLHGPRLATRQQAKDEVLDWLHWYNRKRLHSTLHYWSPMEYERKWKQRTTPAVSGPTRSSEEAMEKRESPNRFPLPTAPATRYIHLWDTDFKGKLIPGRPGPTRTAGLTSLQATPVCSKT